ncbi:MAG TPA: hypothetical protein ENK82_04110, partial [Campylobacterales bacterium]|nr:hypothetical protein [Campylobacterales bacterium]
MMARTGIIAFVLILLMAYLSDCSNKEKLEEKKEVETTSKKVEKSHAVETQQIQSLSSDVKRVTSKTTKVEKSFQSAVENRIEQVSTEVLEEDKALVKPQESDSETREVSHEVTVETPKTVVTEQNIPKTVTSMKAVEVNQSVTKPKEVSEAVTVKTETTEVQEATRPVSPIAPNIVDTKQELPKVVPAVKPVEVNQSLTQPKQVLDAVKATAPKEVKQKSEDIVAVTSPIKAISTVTMPSEVKTPAAPKVKEVNISVPEISSSVKAPDVKSMKEFASNSKTLDLYYEEQTKKESVIAEKKGLLKELTKLKERANEIKEEYTGIVRGLSRENKVLKTDLETKVTRVHELEAKIANMLSLLTLLTLLEI